jgi:hypothetical protein
LLQITHAGDTRPNGKEDDGRNQHFNQADEPFSERLHLLGEAGDTIFRGEEEAKDNTERNTYQHPEVNVLVKGLFMVVFSGE